MCNQLSRQNGRGGGRKFYARQPGISIFGQNPFEVTNVFRNTKTVTAWTHNCHKI